ncbi:HNH endonuclease signature motif containing protein [Microbacterium flavum]|uniref:HNH endonuclease signature motif containing protein n=1 Tax=Microbacterium flavum TaxID=415216 RepID=UPI0024AD5F8F|nr:HNH endonuclease signature motif containing protein [Microbacterium flavum]
MPEPQHPDRPVRHSVVFQEDSDASADRHGREPHWAELPDLVSRAEDDRAAMARLQAERAEVCAEALDLVALRVAQRDAAHPGREIGDTIPLREVLAELSTALRVGERTVSSWLGDGAALVGTYPATLAALRDGRIDERHASALIDGGLALDHALRAEYEERVLAIAATETAAATREYARVVAARLQPAIVAQARERALDDRRVRAFDLDDGLARLLLDAPAVLVHGIFERLTSMGIAQGTTDAADAADGDLADTRTLDQRRADLACDLLLCGAPATEGDAALGAIRATVQVTIPCLTFAGLDDDPAMLDGRGSLDGDTARRLAAAATSWHRVMTDPVTSEPLCVDSYRPSAHLRRLLAARDRHCRWPGCRRPVKRCDIDHIVPFEQGGATSSANLEVLCRGHHTLKHASRWTVRAVGSGTLEFVSPTGRRHRTDAPMMIAATPVRDRWSRFLDAHDKPG